MAKPILVARKKIYPDNQEGKDLFEIHWHALRVNFGKHQKGKGGLKLMLAVKKALVSVSHVIDRDSLGEIREKKSGEQSILLYGFEYDKLRAVVNDEDTPWSIEFAEKVDAAREDFKLETNWPEVELGESS